MRPQDASPEVWDTRPPLATLARLERDPRTGLPGSDRGAKRREEQPAPPRTASASRAASSVAAAARTSRPWVLAAAAVGVLLIGGGSWAAVSSGRAEPSAGPSSATSDLATSPAASLPASTTPTPTTASTPSGTGTGGVDGIRLAIASPCPHVPAGAPAAILGRPLVATFVLTPGQAYPRELANPLPSMSHQCRYYAAPQRASGRTASGTTRVSVPRSVVISVDGRPMPPQVFAARVARGTGGAGCSVLPVESLGGVATSATRCTTAQGLGVTSGFVSVSGLFGTTLLSCAAETAPAGEASGFLPELVRLCATVRDALPRA